MNIAEKTPSISRPLHTYNQLDLSEDSDIVAALFKQLDKEIGNCKVLTSHSQPDVHIDGITAGMANWFARYIAPKRTAAIAETEHLSRQITIGENVPGFLIKTEQQNVHAKHSAEKLLEIQNFRNAHSNDIEQFEKLNREYKEMRVNEGNRDAKTPSAAYEWLVLVPFIMLFEGFLNYDSFYQHPLINTVFVAFGVTVIVGIGIAVSAHLMGRYLKAYYYYNRARDSKKRVSGVPQILLSVLLLSVCLAVIGYARYHSAQGLPSVDVFTDSAPNVFVQVGGLILGNVVVFLIGTAFAFMLHDPNPEFSDKKRELDRQTRSLEIRRRPVEKKIVQIDRSLTENLGDLERKSKQLLVSPHYAKLNELTDQIESVDNNVLGLLGEYKSALIARIAEHDPHFQFEQPDDADLFKTPDKHLLSMSEFASRQHAISWRKS